MKKITLIPMLILALLFSATTASAARISDNWSGVMYHYNINTGTTNTEYYYYIDIDTQPVSWDRTRKEVSYSGYTANYYTARFMDPNISYSFLSSFTYRKGSSGGSIIGSISPYTWGSGNKYAYILRGSPWRSGSGGSSNYYMTDSNMYFHLTTTITMQCSKDSGTLACGSKTFTKVF